MNFPRNVGAQEGYNSWLWENIIHEGEDGGERRWGGVRGGRRRYGGSGGGRRKWGGGGKYGYVVGMREEDKD